MTAVSADSAGGANWRIKRDWRRDLEEELRAEGYDLFAPNPATPDQPPTGGSPITLVAMGRRINGQLAVVVATQTTIWRYTGVADQDWHYLDTGYVDDEGMPPSAYFVPPPGTWMQIGSGFSANGRRWEAFEIFGYLILNNGVDLPVSYRVQDMTVTPLYELREQAVASVGTIAEDDGLLVCGNVKIVKETPQLLTGSVAYVNPHAYFTVTTTQPHGLNTGAVVELSGEPYARGNQFDGDTQVLSGFGVVQCESIGINTFLSTDLILVEGATHGVFNGVFLITVTSPHLLFTYSLPVQSASADDVVTFTRVAKLFNGKFTVTVTGPTTFTCPIGVQRENFSQDLMTVRYDRMTNLMVGPAPYGLVDDSQVDHFQARVLWSAPNGPNRFAAVIPCAVNALSNGLTLKYPVKSITAGMQILIVGAALNGGNLTATVVWIHGLELTVGDQAITNAQSSIAAALLAAQAAYAQALTTKNATTQAVQVDQAALAAANALDPLDPTKPAAISTASQNLNAALLADADATTALTNATAALNAAKAATTQDTEFAAADLFGSVAGKFDDLEGDGSGVIKMLRLRDTLVVYTETLIFLGTYTGDVNTPFLFGKVDIPVGTALHFRDTVVLLAGAGHYANGFAYGGAAHVYAGRNAFYRFDLTNQVPLEMPEFQPCQNLFFDAATSSDVFAVDNPVTKELWFCFPDWTRTPDRALRWDYRFGSLGTTSMETSAAMAIIRPEAQSQIPPEQTEEWFVMGSPGGQLRRYGMIANQADAGPAAIDGGTLKLTKTAQSNTVICSAPFFTSRMVGWSIITDDTETVLAITSVTDSTHATVLGQGTLTGETFKLVAAIWHRNTASYASTLESGMEAFGSASSLKVLDRFTPMLGSNSTDGLLSVTILSAVNPKRSVDVITVSLPNPQETNLIPLLVSGYYLGDRLVATGINNPLRLVARIYDLKQRDYRGYERK